ncbi:hypothetical protein MKX03_015516 [Papaver bracteatum]|nr:hypothetical protein MKX03_015516 [Papaver bracteatum]
MLTWIKKGTVRIASTNITENIVKILLREGFIENVRKHRESNNFFFVLTLRHRRNKKGPYITILKHISRPGGMGIVIFSNSRGIMIDREARVEGIGREILCYIW